MSNGNASDELKQRGQQKEKGRPERPAFPGAWEAIDQ
jgi:hypothetical protein